jgi:hypothetical protein
VSGPGPSPSTRPGPGPCTSESPRNGDGLKFSESSAIPRSEPESSLTGRVTARLTRVTVPVRPGDSEPGHCHGGTVAPEVTGFNGWASHSAAGVCAALSSSRLSQLCLRAESSEPTASPQSMQHTCRGRLRPVCLRLRSPTQSDLHSHAVGNLIESPEDWVQSSVGRNLDPNRRINLLQIPVFYLRSALCLIRFGHTCR